MAMFCCGIMLLVVMCGGAVQGQEEKPGGLSWAEKVPERTDDVLINPGMGLYLFGSKNFELYDGDSWHLRLFDILYYRIDWADVEPEERQYQFQEYFGPVIEEWVKRRGKRFSFRIMSENKHSQKEYVTPRWVFDKGVPGVDMKGLYVPHQFDPVFWDERYLAEQERFIAALGAFFDGMPGLEFVDIGSIGEWGEMHLGRWTPEQKEQTGFTEEKYIAAYRRIIDAFARAFPHTAVFLNVGSYHCIDDYAALRGLHFRQDGLKPGGASYNVGEWLYKPYARRGVKCNFEFHSDLRSMREKGWGLTETLQAGLDAPISYLHINLLKDKGFREAPDDVRALLQDAARRVGYRFVATKVRFLQQFHLVAGRPSRMLLQHTWKNIGVAPCYESYALQYTVLNPAGEVVAEHLHFPRTPTTHWWPGEEVTERLSLRLPPDLPAGRYTVRVAMLQPEQEGLRIKLGLAGADEQWRYPVCEVEGIPGQAATGPVYQQGFEGEAQLWGAAEGMRASLDRTQPHEGQSCLLLTGTQQGRWNYAFLELPMAVLPGSKYRLSCWMRVDDFEAPKAPYLKIGLTDADDKWFANIGTNVYDTKNLGTWQHLQAKFETPANTAGGHLAIEKGGREFAATATIRLDDVKLELLESP